MMIASVREAVITSGRRCALVQPAVAHSQHMVSSAGFVPYTGDGFALLIPSKYIPSKEQDFKGVKVHPPLACARLVTMSMLTIGFLQFTGRHKLIKLSLGVPRLLLQCLTL